MQSDAYMYDFLLIRADIEVTFLTCTVIYCKLHAAKITKRNLRFPGHQLIWVIEGVIKYAIFLHGLSQ